MGSILFLLTPKLQAQWSAQNSGTSEVLRAASFNNSNGWAIGQNAVALKTTNGGATWTPAAGAIPPVAGGGGTFQGRGIWAFDDQLMWVVGMTGEAWRTVDGGSSWTSPGFTSNPQYDYHDIDFYGDHTGSLGVIVGSSGLVRYSTDGGSSWTNLAGSGTIKKVKVLSTTRAIAVGFEGRVLVFDISSGNPTFPVFSSLIPQDLFDIHMVNSNAGWAVGDDSRVVRTTDGGFTWFDNFFQSKTGVSNAALRAVHFFDSQNGVVTGFGGQRWITQDGGSSWIDYRDTSGTNFFSAQLTSKTSGYNVGQSGTIQRYAVPDITVLIDGIPVPDGGQFNFGTRERNTSTTHTISITNTGSANLTGIISPPPGEEFSFGSQPSTNLTVGSFSHFDLTFTPTSGGRKVGFVEVFSNVAGSKNPYTIEVLGDSPGIPVLKTGRARKFVSNRSSKRQNISIQNTGDGDLLGLRVTKTGRARRDFRIRGPFSRTLSPNAATRIQVKFKTRLSGNRKAKAIVRSLNAGVKAIVLKGKGARKK